MSDESLVTLMERANELLSVLVKVHVRDVLAAELSDPKKKKLYELTDGVHTVRQLVDKLGMSQGAISTTWQEWSDVGILVKRNGKYRRVLE